MINDGDQVFFNGLFTFALGTDLDNAQVQVQNRVAQALPRLRWQTTTKQQKGLQICRTVTLGHSDWDYSLSYLSHSRYF